MVSTGIVQLSRMKEEAEVFTQLGYPIYLLSILGVWKLLGAAAVLMPGLRLVKEWAYAGFFFVMSGAIISHLAVGHPLTDTLSPLLLLVLTMVSWYFRPANRKIQAAAACT